MSTEPSTPSTTTLPAPSPLNREVATVKGKGVVIQDTGKEVTSIQTGELLFFAGGRMHSNDIQGEQIHCLALS